MAKVVAQAMMSLDGYVAKQDKLAGVHPREADDDQDQQQGGPPQRVRIGGPLITPVP